MYPTNKSKILLVTLCLCVILCLNPMLRVQGAEDTPATWAVDEINAAIANGLVPESLLNNYEAPITRADFCLSIVQLLQTYTGSDMNDYLQSKGLLLPKTSPFTDVDDPNVTIAYILGITSGYPDQTFKPNASISRQEAAKMLSNTFFALEKSTEAEATLYDDTAEISNWAKTSIALVDAYDIMNGVGNNRFNPKGTYQRQMAILTMNRLFKNVDSAPNLDNAPTTAYHYLVYGLGNGGDYTMTFGDGSDLVHQTEYQKDGHYFTRRTVKNRFDESFEMEVYVTNERDYFVIPSLGRMASYDTGHEASLMSQMVDAVHHDLVSSRLLNGTALYTYGIPFFQDETMSTHYTFTMDHGDLVQLDITFNGRTTVIPNIKFTFESLDEALFEVPQDLEHYENNWVDDGEWAPFWWELHPETSK